MSQATSLELNESLDERVDRLADELSLAIRWNRPSILLAVYRSHYVRLDAQVELAEQLRPLNHRIEVFTVDGQDNADIPLRLSEHPELSRTLFFIEGLQSGGPAALRALNVRREFFVEYRIRAVFWLTENEALAVARDAPDFWAFRHRVVDFLDRPEPHRAAEMGRELTWADFEDRTLRQDTDAKIALRQALLEDLPVGDETLAARAELQFTLAGLYWARGDFGESIRRWHETIRCAERLGDIRLVSWSHNGLGAVYANLGQSDAAIAAFQRAIALNPQFAYPHHGLGNVYANLGQSDAAIAAYQRAIELDPTFAGPHHGLGNVYQALGQYDAAITAYQRVIELDPQDFNPYLGLAPIYRELGDVAQSAHYAAQARTLIPPDDWYNLACLESIEGNVEVALEYLARAAQQEDFDPAWARQDPYLEWIRDDPRFRVIVGEAGRDG